MIQTDQWLDTAPDGYFFTNREMIDNPEYAYDGWFNPFTEPDKLIKQRKDYKTGKGWFEYCVDFYPGIDPLEQYNLKIQDNKNRKIDRCGEISIQFNKKGIPYFATFHCGICGPCLSEEATEIKKAVLGLNKPLRLIEVSVKDRAKVTRQMRDKGIEYQTYLIDNGSKIQMLVDTDNEEIGKAFNAREFDYNQWTKTEKKQRRSGNLLPPSRKLVRNDREDNEDEEIVDSGKIFYKQISAKFEKLPEYCTSHKQALEIAAQYAIAKTIDFAPKDIIQQQKCIRVRENLTIKAIEKLGGVVFGIDNPKTSMHYMTEDNGEVWLEAAEMYSKDGWQEYLE